MAQVTIKLLMIIYWINQTNIKGKKKKTHYQLLMFIRLGARSL